MGPGNEKLNQWDPAGGGGGLNPQPPDLLHEELDHRTTVPFQHFFLLRLRVTVMNEP